MTIPIRIWWKAWEAEYDAIEAPGERAWFMAGVLIALFRIAAGGVFSRTRARRSRMRLAMGALLLVTAVGNFIYDTAVPDRMGYFAWLVTVVFIVGGVLLLTFSRGGMRRSGRYGVLLAGVWSGLGVARCDAQAATDSAALARAVERIVAEYQQTVRAPGVSVGIARDGRVLLARGFGSADVERSVPATSETVYRVGSISKQFTAHLILQLIDARLLALDDPIGRYLPELSASVREIPLWRVLNHTAGLPSYPDSLVRSQAMRLDWPADSVVHWIARRPPDFPPGARFQYSNGGYYLLGVIAERVTKRPYAELLREKIFRPLGMSASAYCDDQRIVPNRAEGYGLREDTVVRADYLSMSHVFAAGAVCSSVGDMLRWQRALHERRLISDSLYRRMVTPVAPAGPPGRQYGFGVIIAEVEGHHFIGHSGGINGFSTFSLHIPASRTDLVVLTNSQNSEPIRVIRPLLELLDPPR